MRCSSKNRLLCVLASVRRMTIVTRLRGGDVGCVQVGYDGRLPDTLMSAVRYLVGITSEHDEELTVRPRQSVVPE